MSGPSPTREVRAGHASPSVGIAKQAGGAVGPVTKP